MRMKPIVKIDQWCMRIANTRLLLLWCILYCPHSHLWGQEPFMIDKPVVDTLEFAITDSVYVAPDGDDANSGSVYAPLRTFNAAINHIPFNDTTDGITHVYGLVILKEGHYQQSFIQSQSQWQHGDHFKHISVRGEGVVTIGGTKDSPLEGHLMQLRGSHIYIKNINLRYGGLVGLILSGEARFPRTMSDIIMEDVTVDSVASHGILINYAERVAASRVTVRHSGGYDPPIPPFPCRTWPSGFKPYFSDHVQITESVVQRNWGEGINFHNCQYAKIQACMVSDNHSTNIYSDNSSKYIIRNNLIYNTPGIMEHWRSCYGFEEAPVAPRGISLANERSCPVTRGFIVNRTIDCALECIHPFNGTVRIPTIDSIYAYNNIIVNISAAFSLWEGVTELATSCMRNVYIVHNTCIGVDSDPEIRNTAMVNFNFASGVNLALRPLSSIESSLFAQNIFSFRQDDFPNLNILRRVLHPTFPAPFDVEFSQNIWNVEPAAFGFDSLSRVAPDLFDEVDMAEAMSWSEHTFTDYVHEGNPYPFVVDDFLGRERTIWTEGAIETKLSTSSNLVPAKVGLKLYPNPGQNFVIIESEEDMTQIQVTDAHGRTYHLMTYFDHPISKVQLATENFTPGLYIINAKLINGEKMHMVWVKQ